MQPDLFPIKVTHDELCEAARRWLGNNYHENCPVVFVEMHSAHDEIADAIGFNSNHSVLVECKVSRADFLRDQKKFYRVNPQFGIGNFRLYMCPAGLIAPDEVPEKWGLLWYDPATRKVEIVKNIFHGNNNSGSQNKFETVYKSERLVMYSGLRRLVEENRKLKKKVKK